MRWRITGVWFNGDRLTYYSDDGATVQKALSEALHTWTNTFKLDNPSDLKLELYDPYDY